MHKTLVNKNSMPDPDIASILK